MSLQAPTAASPKALDHADVAHAGSADAGGARTDAASDTVDIYTDGACKGNPGPGGWGALLRSGAHERELFGGQPLTTNNRMELTAVIEALRALRRASRVRVWTDSQYVRLGITQWIAQWRARGWRTADRKPVKNADLWQSLEAACAPHAIEWHWVRGHAGHPGNERADALANRGVPASDRAGRP